MTTRLLKQTCAVAIVAVLGGGGLTLVEHRILSGYWWHQTSVVAGMTSARVRAVSELTESARGELEPATSVVVDLRHLCGWDGLSSCVEGQTAETLFGEKGVPASISNQLDRAEWSTVWNAARIHNHASGVTGLGAPAYGTLMQFSHDHRNYAWLMYRTHEIEDDWHRGVQLLYAVSENHAELVRWNSYRYEIAGLEGIPMWLLWLVNSIVLAVAGGARMITIQGAPSRAVRILKPAATTVLMLLGLAFGWAALAGAARHDPWLVVLLLTAALMIASASLIGPRRGSKSGG
jgi:hypothetical protein